MKSNTSVKIDREEDKGLIKNFVESKYGKLDKVEITFYDDSSDDLTYVNVTFEGFKTELEINKTDKADKSPDDLQNLPPYPYFVNPLLSNEDKLEVRLADLINTVNDLLPRMRDVEENVKTAGEWTIKEIQAVTNKSDELVKRVEDIEYDEEACDKAVEVLEERVDKLVKEVGQGNQIVEGHSVVITKLTERVENNHNTAFILTARVSVLEDKIKKLEASNKQLDKHVNKLMSVRMDGILKDCNKLLNNGWIQDNEGYWSHLNLKSFNKCSVEGAIRIQNNWDEMAKEGNNSVSGKEDLAKRVEDLEKKLEDPIYIKAEWNDTEVGSGKEEKIDADEAYLTSKGWNYRNSHNSRDNANWYHSKYKGTYFDISSALDIQKDLDKEVGSGKIDQVEGFKKRLFLNGWKMNDAGYFSHDKLKGQDCILRVAMEIQEEWDKTSGSGKEDKCAGCVKDTKENLHSVFCQNCAADQFISYNKGEGEELKAMEKGDEKVDRLYNAGWRMSLCGWTHDSKRAINLSYQEAHKTQDIWDKTSGLITEKMAEAKAKRNKLKKNEDVETDEAYLTCYGWNTQCGGDGIIWVHPTIGEAINAKVAIRMQNDAIKKAREQERLESPYGFHSVNPLRTAQREKDSREKKAAEYLMSKGWTWDRHGMFHPNIGSSSTLEGAMDMQKAYEKRDKNREEKNG